MDQLTHVYSSHVVCMSRGPAKTQLTLYGKSIYIDILTPTVSCIATCEQQHSLYHTNDFPVTLLEPHIDLTLKHAYIIQHATDTSYQLCLQSCKHVHVQPHRF